MSGQVPYQNTDTTGDTGRATARGLDRLDFNPLVLLLFGGLILIIAGVWLLNFQSRDPDLRERQYSVLRESLERSPQGEAGRLEIPPMEAWTLASHGHIDEWSGEILVMGEDGGGEADRIVVDFNVKTGPTDLRARDWIGPKSSENRP